MKNINIPEPCSENWNEMTPTEKGAFCQKCALDVYDFTNKTGDEIRDILTLNIGSPVCMRIEPKQIEELNDDFAAWKMTNKRSFNRAWVFTLFVVFGMTLFSCEEDEKPVVERFQQIGQTFLSKVKISDPVSELGTQLDSISVKSIDEKTILFGGVPDDIEPQITTITGEVHFEPQVEVAVRNEEVPINCHGRDRVHATAGVPRISPEYNTYLLEKIESPTVEIESNEIDEITGLAYPNPASNQTTLQITTPKKGKGEIQLFGLNGQKIRTIHAGRIKKGVSEYPIDLTDLETGMYLLVVQSGKMKETIKFSKI